MKKIILILMIGFLFGQADYSSNTGAKTLYNYFHDFITNGTIGTSSLSMNTGKKTYQNEFIDFILWADTTTIVALDGDTVKVSSMLYLKESTTPTAYAGWGAVYPKADNHLYFQDGAGAEYQIELGSSDYGEMGVEYGSTVTEVLASADQWYGMYDADFDASAPHLNSGFTFTAGIAGVIASASTSAGDSVIVTDAAHGLSNNDYITQNGMSDASYNGVYKVYSVTTDTYTIVETNTESTETGFWQRGSYLLCATSGKYRGVWTATLTQPGTNKKVHVTPYLNDAQSTKAYSYRHYSSSTDVGSQSGNGLMNFSAGDKIWFGVMSDAAQTITFEVFNMSVH